MDRGSNPKGGRARSDGFEAQLNVLNGRALLTECSAVGRGKSCLAALHGCDTEHCSSNYAEMYRVKLHLGVSLVPRSCKNMMPVMQLRP